MIVLLPTFECFTRLSHTELNITLMLPNPKNGMVFGEADAWKNICSQ